MNIHIISISLLLTTVINYTNSIPLNFISLKKGKTYIIELPSNPSTGYTWKNKPLPKNAAISIEEHSFEPSDKKTIGAPGKQYWVIKAKWPAKKAELILEYKRPWETDKAPAQVKQYEFYIY